MLLLSTTKTIGATGQAFVLIPGGDSGPAEAQEVDIVINVKSAPTGGAPAVTFSVAEVDPIDETTVVGATVTGAAIREVGSQILTLAPVRTGAVLITWTYAGPGVFPVVDIAMNAVADTSVTVIPGAHVNTASDAIPGAVATYGGDATFLYAWNGASWDRVRVNGSDGALVVAPGSLVSTSSDAVPGAAATFGGEATFLYAWNGASWDRVRTDGSDGALIITQVERTHIAVCTAYADHLVLLAAPGVIYNDDQRGPWVTVLSTLATTPGLFLQLHDAVAAANGATPVDQIPFDHTANLADVLAVGPMIGRKRTFTVGAELWISTTSATLTKLAGNNLFRTGGLKS